MRLEDNLNIYNDSALILDAKTPSFVKNWIIILILIFTLIVFTCLMPFNVYSTYNGYVIYDDDKLYISFLVNDIDFPINKNNNLYIKYKKYKYKVLRIEDNNVLIHVKLPDGVKINNNIVVINILKNRTTIFKIIKNELKKGFCV